MTTKTLQLVVNLQVYNSKMHNNMYLLRGKQVSSSPTQHTPAQATVWWSDAMHLSYKRTQLQGHCFLTRNGAQTQPRLSYLSRDFPVQQGSRLDQRPRSLAVLASVAPVLRFLLHHCLSTTCQRGRCLQSTLANPHKLAQPERTAAVG